MATKALQPNQQGTYDTARNSFVRRAPITLKTSAAETASYTTDDGIQCDALTLSLNMNLTASSSPTSIIVTVQGGPDGTIWYDLGIMKTTGGVGQLGAVATGDLYYEGPGAKWIRYKSTIVGTSFTYSVTGTYRF
jgi:hypothetical protein